MSAFALLAGLAVSAAAPAQAAPLNLSSKKAPNSCGTAAPGEVVVCGDRQQSPYRIDPVTLDAMRTEQALKNPDRVASREPPPAACGVGNNICGGQAIPIAQAAIKVATALVKAAKGEDWREPFRTGPDEYQLYEQSKAKHERITVSVSAGVSNSQR